MTTTALYNYLLHGERLWNPQDIENAEFREYLKDLFPYIILKKVKAEKNEPVTETFSQETAGKYTLERKVLSED